MKRKNSSTQKLPINLSDDFFRDALTLMMGSVVFPPGGQELIALEIVSALKAHDCKELWLPFSIGPLANFVFLHGISCYTEAVPLAAVDSLYLGTPTIVDDKILFADSAKGAWNKRAEREAVRSFCADADRLSARLIVTGLGSGDVSVEERSKDMKLPGWNKPRVVCMKDFGTFTDWVLITERK